MKTIKIIIAAFAILTMATSISGQQLPILEELKAIETVQDTLFLENDDYVKVSDDEQGIIGFFVHIPGSSYFTGAFEKLNGSDAARVEMKAKNRAETTMRSFLAFGFTDEEYAQADIDGDRIIYSTKEYADLFSTKYDDKQLEKGVGASIVVGRRTLTGTLTHEITNSFRVKILKYPGDTFSIISTSNSQTRTISQ